jgi:hypothetical protein
MELYDLDTTRGNPRAVIIRQGPDILLLDYRGHMRVHVSYSRQARSKWIIHGN